MLRIESKWRAKSHEKEEKPEIVGIYAVHTRKEASIAGKFPLCSTFQYVGYRCLDYKTVVLCS